MGTYKTCPLFSSLTFPPPPPTTHTHTHTHTHLSHSFPSNVLFCRPGTEVVVIGLNPTDTAYEPFFHYIGNAVGLSVWSVPGVGVHLYQGAVGKLGREGWARLMGTVRHALVRQELVAESNPYQCAM